MNMINRVVETVMFMDIDGFPKPLRFRLFLDGEYHVFTELKIWSCEVINRNGLKYYKYECETVNNEVKRIVELRFYVGDIRWVLFRG